MNPLVIPSPFDAHVHLRQGEVMQLVVPHVGLGGVKLAYVMVRLSLSLMRAAGY